MSTLEVTQVQVFPLTHEQGKLKAFARVLLADQIQLTSLRIYEGSKGLFVSYPNDPAHHGEDYRQLFYPVTRELRDAIEQAVLAEWERMNKPKTVRVVRRRAVTEYIDVELPLGKDISDLDHDELNDQGLADWTELDWDNEILHIKEI